MMLVLTVSLLIILLIENSTFAIYSVVNQSVSFINKDNHCLLILNFLSKYSTPTGMNNPTYRGHKDYLSV